MTNLMFAGIVVIATSSCLILGAVVGCLVIWLFPGDKK